MPCALRGKWTGPEGALFIDKKHWISETTDSLGVTTQKVEFILSDSLILKKYKRYFFFNTLSSNSYWNVYVGYQRNGFFVIKSLGKGDSLAINTNLGLLPDSSSKSDRFYNTPINKKQIVKFIESGGFCDTLFLFDIRKRKLLK